MYCAVSYCVLMKWQKFTQHLDSFSAKWTWSFALWSVSKMNELTTNWIGKSVLHWKRMRILILSCSGERDTQKRVFWWADNGFSVTQNSLKLSDTDLVTWSGIYIGGHGGGVHVLPSVRRPFPAGFRAWPLEWKMLRCRIFVLCLNPLDVWLVWVRVGCPRHFWH